VNHSILPTKLEHYGANRNAFKLIQSYPSNRKQYVQGGNTKSSESQLFLGSPRSRF